MEKPIFKNKQNEMFNINGNIIWNSRSVAVNVVVLVKFNNNIYLLCGQRGLKTPDFQGYWNVPCGYLDWNEDGTEACYREVFEECGLNLNEFINNSIILNQHMISPWKVITSPSSNRQNISLRYGVVLQAKYLPILTNEYCEEGEVSKLEWYKLESIDSLKYKEWAFQHDELIKDYLKLNSLLNSF